VLDNWDYEEHKNRQLVTKACHDLQVRVAKDLEEIKKVKQDTRAFHLEMFNSVTPADKRAFAGNYRGSEFQYLKTIMFLLVITRAHLLVKLPKRCMIFTYYLLKA